MRSILCLSTLIHMVLTCTSSGTEKYTPSAGDIAKVYANKMPNGFLTVHWYVWKGSEEKEEKFKVTVSPPDHPPIFTAFRNVALFGLDPSEMYTIKVNRLDKNGELVGPGRTVSIRMQD